MEDLQSTSFRTCLCVLDLVCVRRCVGLIGEKKKRSARYGCKCRRWLFSAQTRYPNKVKLDPCRTAPLIPFLSFLFLNMDPFSFSISLPLPLPFALKAGFQMHGHTLWACLISNSCSKGVKVGYDVTFSISLLLDGKSEVRNKVVM